MDALRLQDGIMKSYFSRLWKSGQAIIQDENDPRMNRSCAGRLLNSLTFIVVIICLGVWITAFLVLRDHLSTETPSGVMLTDMTCLTFFGGLIISIFIGALTGNFLRRAFWKRLSREKKC
jgi:hypothetical protein